MGREEPLRQRDCNLHPSATAFHGHLKAPPGIALGLLEASAGKTHPGLWGRRSTQNFTSDLKGQSRNQILASPSSVLGPEPATPCTPASGGHAAAPSKNLSATTGPEALGHSPEEMMHQPGRQIVQSGPPVCAVGSQHKAVSYRLHSRLRPPSADQNPQGGQHLQFTPAGRPAFIPNCRDSGGNQPGQSLLPQSSCLSDLQASGDSSKGCLPVQALDDSSQSGQPGCHTGYCEEVSETSSTQVVGNGHPPPSHEVSLASASSGFVFYSVRAVSDKMQLPGFVDSRSSGGEENKILQKHGGSARNEVLSYLQGPPSPRTWDQPQTPRINRVTGSRPKMSRPARAGAPIIVQFEDFGGQGSPTISNSVHAGPDCSDKEGPILFAAGSSRRSEQSPKEDQVRMDQGARHSGGAEEDAPCPEASWMPLDFTIWAASVSSTVGSAPDSAHSNAEYVESVGSNQSGSAPAIVPPEISDCGSTTGFRQPSPMAPARKCRASLPYNGLQRTGHKTLAPASTLDGYDSFEVCSPRKKFCQPQGAGRAMEGSGCCPLHPPRGLRKDKHHIPTPPDTYGCLCQVPLPLRPFGPHHFMQLPPPFCPCHTVSPPFCVGRPRPSTLRTALSDPGLLHVHCSGPMQTMASTPSPLRLCHSAPPFRAPLAHMPHCKHSSGLHRPMGRPLDAGAMLTACNEQGWMTPPRCCGRVGGGHCGAEMAVHGAYATAVASDAHSVTGAGSKEPAGTGRLPEPKDSYNFLPALAAPPGQRLDIERRRVSVGSARRAPAINPSVRVGLAGQAQQPHVDAAGSELPPVACSSLTDLPSSRVQGLVDDPLPRWKGGFPWRRSGGGRRRRSPEDMLRLDTNGVGGEEGQWGAVAGERAMDVCQRLREYYDITKRQRPRATERTPDRHRY